FRVAAVPDSLRPDVLDERANVLLCRGRQEDTFGVPRCERAPSGRDASLEQHRRALWRRFAEMYGVDTVTPPDMIDGMDLGRVRVDAVDPVDENRVILPASFEELVDGLHVLVRQLIAVVMRDLLLESHRPRRTVEISGDDVPARPSLREVIEGRK